MTRLECPICEDRDYRTLDNGTPYVQCYKCDFWYQRELAPKVYEGSHEASGDTMSQGERNVNYSLAEQLHNMFFEDKDTNSFALDIGAKFPWLMHCLKMFGHGKIQTWAIDGIPEIEQFCKKYELAVNGFQCDFETADKYPWSDIQFDLITMVHVIEHFYNPLHTLSKVFNILKPDGKLFIRCPAHDVKGIERDFTDSHYTIHPQIWGKRSLEYMAESLGFKILMQNELRPGQRDLVLVKQ